MSSVSFKGPSGVPLSHAKGTEELRVVDPSSLGIIGLSTPYDVNAGVTKTLTQNAAITTINGKFKFEDVEGKNSSNLFSLTEQVTPYTMRHSDPPRVSMALTQ